MAEAKTVKVEKPVDPMQERVTMYVPRLPVGEQQNIYVNINGKDAIVILPTIDLSSDQKNGFTYGAKINVTFGGNVVHMFSKATEKNLI